MPRWCVMYKDGLSPLPVCGVSLAVTSTKPGRFIVLWFMSGLLTDLETILLYRSRGGNQTGYSDPPLISSRFVTSL